MIDFLMEIDQAVFLFLNALHFPLMDEAMYIISYRFTWIPLYLLLIYLVARRHGWHVFWFLLFMLVLITLSDQLSVLAKNTFMRPRPCHEPELQELIHLVRGRCGGAFGFVSSHACNTFALAGFYFFAFRHQWRGLSIGLLWWAGIIGYSRIYLGVHYPGDVLFGALLGLLIGWLVALAWNAWMSRLAGVRRPKLQ